MGELGGQVHRVLVIDDQLIVRAGMATLLDALPGWACIGGAPDVARALQSCEQMRPDLVLLDLHLPDVIEATSHAPPSGPLAGLAALQGLELARQLRGLYPRLRILVLSGRTETEVVRAALRAGADGFIAKHFVRHELVQALEAVLSGRRWLSPSIATALQAADQATAGLTPRQRDVLAHIARGQSNKQIARSLGISVKTVEYHRGELIARLDLHDVASLTRYALSQGLAS